MQEEYNGYLLITNCKKTIDHRFSVRVILEKRIGNTIKRTEYQDNKISLLLEVEAEKESINLGKNIIKNGLVYF